MLQKSSIHTKLFEFYFLLLTVTSKYYDYRGKLFSQVESLNLYILLQDVLKSTRAQLERELLMDDVLRIEDMPSYSLLSWMASNKLAGSRTTVLFIWYLRPYDPKIVNLSHLYLLYDTWHLPVGWFYHSNLNLWLLKLLQFKILQGGL